MSYSLNWKTKMPLPLGLIMHHAMKTRENVGVAPRILIFRDTWR